MCMDCFKQYTESPVVNARVQAAYDLIQRCRDPYQPPAFRLASELPSGIVVLRASDEPRREPRDPSFGNLHVIIGDMNVGDGTFEWWEDEWDGEKEEWEQEIFDALKPLSEAERATVIAMDWGYFDRAGSPIIHEPQPVASSSLWD